MAGTEYMMDGEDPGLAGVSLQQVPKMRVWLCLVHGLTFAGSIIGVTDTSRRNYLHW